MELGFPSLTRMNERQTPLAFTGFGSRVEAKWQKSCRSSGWDLELGFNVHSYRERYPQVLALAAQDLEIRGFIVDNLELEEDGNGIYIKYSLKLPEQ